MESSRRWNNTALLDDLFMKIAEGDASFVPHVQEALLEAPTPEMATWPEAVRDTWESGLELALEGLSPADLPQVQPFLLCVAAAGYDSMLLRDHLGAVARSRFADYLDPAGLLGAFGIHDTEAAPADIVRRWHVFEALKPGCRCFDPRQGMGSIEAVDDIANHVRIRYERVLDQPLERVLNQIVLVQPGALVDKLIQNGEAALDDLGGEHPAEALRAGLTCAMPVDDAVLKAILTPSPLSAEALDALLGEQQAVEAQAAEDGPVRQWYEARSIYELVGLLQDLQTIDAAPARLEHVTDLLQVAAARLDAVDEFAEALARLRLLSGRMHWLEAILKDLGPKATAWNDTAVFARVTDDLAGRLVPPWLAATATARGVEYLAEITLTLPLRLWAHSERVIGEIHGREQLLLDTVVKAVEGGNVPADALLWLYRRGGEPATLLANPPLLFRTLEKPVRGSYIKANKDLRKMLMDDQAVQRLIMKDGDPDAIASLVRTVRHASLLDSGERQSLLVKIVRVFPEAKEMIEQKQRKLGKKAVGKITSIRTFHSRRRELEHIINVDVPANARAIAHARSYGDLRENAEFKAAKERQAYLTARRAELEEDLNDIKPTDFRDVKPDEVVIPGSTVTVTDDDGQTTRYHLMGVWDSVPEQHIVSYRTPVGTVLMGSRIGDRVTMPAGEEVTVTAVEALSDALLDWAGNAEATS